VQNHEVMHNNKSKAKDSIWKKFILFLNRWLFPSEYELARKIAKKVMRRVGLYGHSRNERDLQDEIAKALIAFKFNFSKKYKEEKRYWTDKEMCAFAIEYYSLKVDESIAVDENLKRKKENRKAIIPVNVWNALEVYDSNASA
jgi:hypothetical protein